MNKTRENLGFYSCTVPTFMQYVLTELIDNGDFERHINRVRRGLRKQNKSLYSRLFLAYVALYC